MTHFPPKCQEIWHFWNTSENLKPWPKSIRPYQSVSQSNQTINPNDHLSSWQLTWPNWSICLNQSIHQAQPVHSTCNLSSVYHFIKSVHHSFQKGHPHLSLAQHSHTESGWSIMENKLPEVQWRMISLPMKQSFPNLDRPDGWSGHLNNPSFRWHLQLPHEGSITNVPTQFLQLW